jgi:hypothetical protein
MSINIAPGTVMGFAALYPSYEVCDFCLRAALRAQARQSRTVATLRQSRPFRRGPVVLRFANRPRPPLLSAQFAFPGVALPVSVPRKKARLRKGCAFAGQFA